jgi:hypothetical protein
MCRERTSKWTLGLLAEKLNETMEEKKEKKGGREKQMKIE